MPLRPLTNRFKQITKLITHQLEHRYICLSQLCTPIFHLLKHINVRSTTICKLKPVIEELTDPQPIADGMRHPKQHGVVRVVSRIPDVDKLPLGFARHQSCREPFVFDAFEVCGVAGYFLLEVVVNVYAHRLQGLVPEAVCGVDTRKFFI